MDELNEKIELIGQDIKGQLSVMEKVVTGSETQEVATKSLERTVNSYAKLVETQQRIKHDEAELELQKQRLEQEAKEAKQAQIQKWVDTGLAALKAACGVGLFWILARVESIDYSNGEIASKPVATQRKAAADVVKGWFAR